MGILKRLATYQRKSVLTACGAAFLLPALQSKAHHLEFLIELVFTRLDPKDEGRQTLALPALLKLLDGLPNEFDALAASVDPIEDLHNCELATDNARGRFLNGANIGQEFEGQALLCALSDARESGELSERLLSIANLLMLLSDRMLCIAERHGPEPEGLDALRDALTLSRQQYTELAVIANCDVAWMDDLEAPFSSLLGNDQALLGITLRRKPIALNDDGSRTIILPTALWCAFRVFCFTSLRGIEARSLAIAYARAIARKFLNQLSTLGETLVVECPDSNLQLIKVKYDEHYLALLLLPDATFKGTWDWAGDIPTKWLQNLLERSESLGRPDFIVTADYGSCCDHSPASIPGYEDTPILNTTAEQFWQLLRHSDNDVSRLRAFTEEYESLNESLLTPHYTLTAYELFDRDGTMKMRLGAEWSQTNFHFQLGGGQRIRREVRQKEAPWLWYRHPDDGMVRRTRRLLDLPFVKAACLLPEMASGGQGSRQSLYMILHPLLWLKVARPPKPTLGVCAAYETITRAIAYWWSLIFADEWPRPNVEVRADVELLEPEKWGMVSDWDESNPLEIAGSATTESARLSIRIKPSFQAEIQRSDGTADRMLMVPLVQRIAELLSLDLSASLTEFYRLASLPKHCFLLGWEGTGPRFDSSGLRKFEKIPLHKKSQVLVDVGLFLLSEGYQIGALNQDPEQALNKAVRFLLQSIEEALQQHGSSDSLIDLVSRHESALAENKELEARSGARYLGYDQDDLVEQKSQAVDACLSSRFLLECMAAVPFAASGKMSKALTDDLLAACSHVINLGMASSIAHSKITGVELLLRANGLFTCRTDASAETNQYRRDMLDPKNTRFEDTRADRRLFEETDRALEKELGLGLSRFAEVATFLASLAGPEGAGTMPVEDFKVRLTEELNFSENEVNHVMNSWTLTSRPSLLKPPKHFKNRDLQPWRFNRGLSYLARPLILKNDQLYWGSRNVVTAIPLILKLCLDGRYQARSKELQELMSTATNERGRLFNDHVADKLTLDSRFQVEKNVESIGGRALEANPGEPLGDIDVLCIDRPRKTLWAIECKSLLASRTPVELANENEKLFDDDKSFLAKLDARARWLRENLAHVHAHYRLPGRPKQWRVLRRIVTERPSLASSIKGDRKAVVDTESLFLEVLRKDQQK